MVTALTDDLAKLTPPGPPKPEGDNGLIVGDPKAKAFEEIGVAGLKIYGGYVAEEFDTQLKTPQQFRVYRAMAEDPIVNAVLMAITLILRAVDWRVEPADDKADGDKKIQNSAAEKEA